MSAFSHVVVGLDGSEAAVNALRWAAQRVPDPSGVEVVHAGAIDPVIPADVEVHTIHSRDSPPAQALIAAAVETNADAIVIGPHGSGFGHGLGSVAKQLLRDAPVPVVVIDGLEPPRPVDPLPPVVACVGYGEPATAASAWAADFAYERSLPLVLLHAVAYRPMFSIDAPSEVLASYLGTGVSASWANDELVSLATELAQNRPGLQITRHVDCTSVIKAVQTAGETAELVVLGKRSDEEFLRVIGTPRLRRLVARSRFPTAVIPASRIVP